MTRIIKHKSFGKIRHLYFIGIGGIGMSGIARILAALGYKVSGSDQNESEQTRELKKLGINVMIGHQAANLKGAQVVVTSSAISPANTELIAAREKKLPVIQRGEMLAELMRLKFGIAVAGTHGKTTTTALVSAVLTAGKLSPTSVIGGKWEGIGTNAELGGSDYLICEADESDGSFLKLSPVLSVVTNIDLDHMDFYRTEENLMLHFHEFINKTPFYGKAIVCADDKRINRLLPTMTKPYTTYGMSEQAYYRAVEIKFQKGLMQFKVSAGKQKLGEFKLAIPGSHNVLNSLAALAIGMELEIPLESIRTALASFKGVVRRMTTLGTWQGFTVVDDYGHHPTEIKATLEAMRFQTDYLVVVFQPHRYTRTLQLYKEFAKAFDLADVLYMDAVYAAGEKPIKDVDSRLIVDRLPEKLKASYIPDRGKLLTAVKSRCQGKTGVILTIGAGDIYKLGKQLVEDSS